MHRIPKGFWASGTTFSMYGTKTLLIIRIVSISLLQCFSLKAKQSLCRKLTFGEDLSVLPVHMSYKRRIIPSNDSQFWARSLVVSDLRSETKGSRFDSGC